MPYFHIPGVILPTSLICFIQSISIPCQHYLHNGPSHHDPLSRLLQQPPAADTSVAGAMSRLPARFQHSHGGQLHSHYQGSYFKHTLESQCFVPQFQLATLKYRGVSAFKGSLQPFGTEISKYMPRRHTLREGE